jgi:hypothetical protein
MAAGTLGTLAWGLSIGDMTHAMALAFTVFVLFQIANALNSRSEQESVFSAETLRNGKLWAALAGVLVTVAGQRRLQRRTAGSVRPVRCADGVPGAAALPSGGGDVGGRR